MKKGQGSSSRRVKSEPRDVSKPMKAEPVVLGPLPSIGLRTAYRSRSEGALAVFQARSRASTAASRCSKRARSGSLIRRTPALQTAFRRHVHNINSGITSSHAFSRSDVSQTLSPARSLRHPSVRTANSEPNTTPGLRYGPAPLLPSRTGTAQTVARSHPDTEVIVDEDVEEGSVVEDDEEDDEDVQIVACRTSQGSVALGNGRTRSQQAGMAFCISWGPIDMPLDCCEAFEVYGVASVTKQKAHVARLVRRFKQKVRSRLQQP